MCQRKTSCLLASVEHGILGLFSTLYSEIIIIIKNERHGNIIVNRLQGFGHSKKLQENESESRSSKVI